MLQVVTVTEPVSSNSVTTPLIHIWAKEDLECQQEMWDSSTNNNI